MAIDDFISSDPVHAVEGKLGEYAHRIVEKPRLTRATDWLIDSVAGALDAPVTWIRGLIEPIRAKNKQYYYHRRFRRVPGIEECEPGDPVCLFEANEQFKRDKLVDSEILRILRNRRSECYIWYGQDMRHKCKKEEEDYDISAANWFAKYGDIGYKGTVLDAFMRQKHRLIWERRNKRSLVTGEPLGDVAATESSSSAASD